MANYPKCVGCGYCCIEVPCGVALRIHGGGLKECPELFWDKEVKMYRCSIMTGDSQIARHYRKELSAGAGCCSSLNTWRQDVKKRHKQDKNTALIPTVMQYFLRSLGKQFGLSGDLISLTVYDFMESLVDAGYDKVDAHVIAKETYRHLKNNRSKMTEEMMG